MPFNNDACRISTLSPRPNNDARPGPQNGSKAATALLTVSCPEPPMAHPTQLRRVRFASCLTDPGRSSKRDAMMNRASFRVASLEASGAEFTIFAPLREVGRETIILQLAAPEVHDIRRLAHKELLARTLWRPGQGAYAGRVSHHFPDFSN